MTTRKNGPLTADDVRRIWESSVDETFSTDFEAGGDEGFAPYGQAFDQLARASAAVDATTQACFVRPSSGQSAPPAGGAARSTVTLTLSRSANCDVPLLFEVGELAIEEVAPDWSPAGTNMVRTGRVYRNAVRVVMMPGDGGPRDFSFVAERPGAGYDNPRPGRITGVVQDGAGYDNDGATVVQDASAASTTYVIAPYVQASPFPQTFVPGHVAAYVEMTAGANAGARFRALAYVPPNGSVGPRVLIDPLVVVRADSGAVEFVVDEVVSLGSAVSYATVVGQVVAGGVGTYLLRIRSGLGAAVAGTASMTGIATGTTVAIETVPLSSVFPLNDAGTAAWRVLSYEADFDMTATNAASPSGGRAAMLDAVGRDRGKDRAPAEDDEPYRARIIAAADAVTPNAIVRTANRALVPIDVRATFLENNTAALPGMFWDVDPYDVDSVHLVGARTGDFIEGEPVYQDQSSGLRATGVYLSASSGISDHVYVGRRFLGNTPFVAAPMDSPVTGVLSGATFLVSSLTGGLRDVDRWRCLFDYEEMRGFFLLAVPRSDAGDFGGFDGVGFYDVSSFDGSPAGEAAALRALWNATSQAVEGGVGFDLDGVI